MACTAHGDENWIAHGNRHIEIVVSQELAANIGRTAAGENPTRPAENFIHTRATGFAQWLRAAATVEISPSTFLFDATTKLEGWFDPLVRPKGLNQPPYLWKSRDSLVS